MYRISLILFTCIQLIGCSNSTEKGIGNQPKYEKELLIGTWSKNKSGTPSIKFTKDSIDYTSLNLPFLTKNRYTLILDTVTIEYPDRKEKYKILKLNKDTLVIISKEGCDTSYKVNIKFHGKVQ